MLSQEEEEEFQQEEELQQEEEELQEEEEALQEEGVVLEEGEEALQVGEAPQEEEEAPQEEEAIREEEEVDQGATYFQTPMRLRWIRVRGYRLNKPLENGISSRICGWEPYMRGSSMRRRRAYIRRFRLRWMRNQRRKQHGRRFCREQQRGKGTVRQS